MEARWFCRCPYCILRRRGSCNRKGPYPEKSVWLMPRSSSYEIQHVCYLTARLQWLTARLEPDTCGVVGTAPLFSCGRSHHSPAGLESLGTWWRVLLFWQAGITGFSLVCLKCKLLMASHFIFGDVNAVVPNWHPLEHHLQYSGVPRPNIFFDISLKNGISKYHQTLEPIALVWPLGAANFTSRLSGAASLRRLGNTDVNSLI